MDLNIKYFTIVKEVKASIKNIEASIQNFQVHIDPNSVLNEMKAAFKMELMLNGKVIKVDQEKPKELEQDDLFAAALNENDANKEAIIPDEVHQLMAKSK